jgi:hypothetical protein
MEFGFDAKTEDYRKRLLSFMDEHVYPAEPSLASHSGWGRPRRWPACRRRPGRPACGTSSYPASAAPA